MSSPIRRSQLIAPFGVGGLNVNREGKSTITCGLDAWFDTSGVDGDSRQFDISEFRINEWRLERRLGVDHFRLPPDFRTKRDNYGQDDEPNLYVYVPVHRFPTWHVCQNKGCRKLHRLNLDTRGYIVCGQLSGDDCKGRLVQVPIVVICENGHAQDFPWKEWVHRTHNPPDCGGTLTLHQRGTGGMPGMEVRCSCSAKPRTLGNVTGAKISGDTHLSSYLASDGGDYNCQGAMPWLGDYTVNCGYPIRASLRSSSSLYFADIRSSIFLPRSSETAPEELVTLLTSPPISNVMNLYLAMDDAPTAEDIRSNQRELLSNFTDDMIDAAIEIVFSDTTPKEASETVASDDEETAYRRVEYEIIRDNLDFQSLKIGRVDLSEFENWFQAFFNRVCLIEKLQETRALVGFSRINPEDGKSLSDKRAMLWRNEPSRKSWLPAYFVHGEGIYFEFDEEKLVEWENNAEGVIARANRLASAFAPVRDQRKLEDRELSPRFILLHTFAHILMMRLTFECGYSTASLRERLYVSSDSGRPMAGVLIYTAAGDAEGTLGGLVRMGKPGNLEPVLAKALDESRWCSADPICMEIGDTSGQGPDSCNLAACHNCSLVPETACEHFNRFLDRGLLVGNFDGSVKGFF